MRLSKLRAFTLVELLISLSILSIIAAVFTISFLSLRKVIDLNRENEELVRDIRGFLERLDVEISSAIYVRRAEGTLFISQRKDIEGTKANNLIFTTAMPQSYLEIGKRGEIIKVEYEVSRNEEDRQLITVTKKVYFITLSTEELQNPYEFTIREDFTSFMFRFYKAGKWYDSWDSKKMDGLPERVELNFSVGQNKFREFFNVFISET